MVTYLRLCAVVLVLAAAAPAADSQPADLPADASLWKRCETLPPTPRGTGHLGSVDSGKFVQFRYAVPKPKPPVYLINIDNIVAMRGGGKSYQAEIHIGSPDGPLLYKGPKITDAHAFNAEDLSRLDATKFLTDADVRRGYIDVWATAWVEDDTWTTYRDTDDGRWDIYALVPDPEAFARWRATQRKREAMLERGICIIPQPQHIELHPDDFRVTGETRVGLSGSTAKEDRAIADAVRAELSRISGLDVSSADEPRRAGVRLVIAPDRAALEKAVGFEVARDVGEQGYALDVRPDGVVAAAHATLGLYYAAQTLMQLMARADGAAVIKGVRIVDWPDLKFRMAQYDIARGNTVNVEYWKRWIRELSRLKINQIMLYMEDDYKFEKYPFLGRPDTFTPEKARELVAYARQHHVELVPQIESLGHASALLSHDELKDLRLAGGLWAICPLAERTVPFLDDLYGELCAAFDQSRLFHVGADEVWGFGADPRCAQMVKEKGEEAVYAFHLNNLQRLLAKRNRKMAFWGDEVLKHPKVADFLTRDVVVFDWHYGNQRAYPSIEFFQERGFKEIYVCPAVSGSFDVYPFLRPSFGNISGFTRAGIEHGVQGVCCTTWGMNRGGNAENFLYGLAYAAECAWSSQETDRKFFDARFARVWLGIPQAKGADADIDRAFWFMWRGSQRGAFWQRRREVARLFFGPCADFADKLNDDDRARFAREARVLDGLCAEALEAIGRLRKAATRNLETLSALEHAVRMHRYVAEKCSVMCELAERYRSTYSATPRDRAKLREIINDALAGLRKIRNLYPVLEKGMKEGIEHRCGDPNDMRMLVAARDAMDDYVKKLSDAQAKIAAGDPPPDPAALGLGFRLIARIWRWRTQDINPSDKEHPRKIVIEVTDHIKSPGTYEVEWDYTRGSDGLSIASTGLYWTASTDELPDDLKPVSVDEHPGFTGGADRNNHYKLTLRERRPDHRYFIVGVVYDQRDFDTSGDVWLKHYWDD